MEKKSSHPLWRAVADAGDLEAGLKLLLPLAEQGNAEAQYLLALLYASPAIKSAKPGEAKMWLERAAEGGNAAAAIKLGLHCEQGHTSPQARMWFERAEELEPGSGGTYLALFYERGLGVPQDEGKAVELYKRAAERGSAGACMALAHAYSNGRLGLARDNERASEYMAKYKDALKASKRERDEFLRHSRDRNLEDEFKSED
jgi:uncharacterized protein